MQAEMNFNTEKHAQMHMSLNDICPKCGQHSLETAAKSRDARCKNSFCGYRSASRKGGRRFNRI